MLALHVPSHPLKAWLVAGVSDFKSITGTVDDGSVKVFTGTVGNFMLLMIYIIDNNTGGVGMHYTITPYIQCCLCPLYSIFYIEHINVYSKISKHYFPI